VTSVVLTVLLTVLIIGGLVLNGLRLRARIPVPLSPPGPAAGDDSADDDPAPENTGLTWLTARGVTPDDTTRRAAARYLRAEDLDMLDLVPSDLPVTAARDLLRAVNPGPYRANRLAPGRSAAAAVLVVSSVAERADAAPARDAEPAELIGADLIGIVKWIRPYTRRDATAIAVAPWLRAARNKRHGDDLDKRAARLRANGAMVALWQTLDAAAWLLVVADLAVSLTQSLGEGGASAWEYWPWSVGAAVVYSLQPYLIFAGTALRPRWLHAAAFLRLTHAPYVVARTAGGRWRTAAERERDGEMARGVRYYEKERAAGTARFLGTRATDCPWCGSNDLSVRVRSRDLVLGKPGRFTLDRCGECGHVFQNPPLRPEGLGFYYRDAYDGLSAADAESLFATGKDSYLGRARMVASIVTPKAWLDVGSGHAHFCVVAHDVLPDTVFDGLDQGAAIAEAERRGWIATAYRGEFPALSETIAGRYDVISMHHYLEHTRDPRAELDAAARVLAPGGHLLIELPDPEWRLAGMFGQYWMPWFQPQHLHMVPLPNLTEALTARGFRTVAIERGAAHQANDFVGAAALLLSRLAPDHAMPWSAVPDSSAWRAWRSLLWTGGVPLIVVSVVLDQVVGRGLARRWDRGNAYRVLAVKEEPVPVSSQEPPPVSSQEPVPPPVSSQEPAPSEEESA
jgi:SAM-dependent methyltransferase